MCRPPSHGIWVDWPEIMAIVDPFPAGPSTHHRPIEIMATPSMFLSSHWPIFAPPLEDIGYHHSLTWFSPLFLWVGVLFAVGLYHPLPQPLSSCSAVNQSTKQITFTAWKNHSLHQSATNKSPTLLVQMNSKRQVWHCLNQIGWEEQQNIQLAAAYLHPRTFFSTPPSAVTNGLWSRKLLACSAHGQLSTVLLTWSYYDPPVKIEGREHNFIVNNIIIIMLEQMFSLVRYLFEPKN